jgi:hypothetical protein
VPEVFKICGLSVLQLRRVAMKRLKQYLYFKYFQWKINRWQRDVALLFKYGNVRQLRQLAEQFKESGLKYNYPDFVKLGERLDECAEKLVLRRIGF